MDNVKEEIEKILEENKVPLEVWVNEAPVKPKDITTAIIDTRKSVEALSSYIKERETIAFWNGVEVQINKPLSYSQFQKERKADLNERTNE